MCMNEEVKKNKIIEELAKIGLEYGVDYDFARHPELCVWTGRFNTARKISKVLGKWRYNIDFKGGYYYWNIEHRE